MFVIKVTGDVIAKDKNHYAQDWQCKTISIPNDDETYDYDALNRTVRSNLILNKRLRSVPYAIYVCEKDIYSQSSGDICTARGARAAEFCYKDNISEIEELLKVTIPADIKDFFYNGLLTGIFSILELFLSDVLLCLIFTRDEVYDRAIDFLKKKKYRLGNCDQKVGIQRYFSNKVVYHQFDTVNDIFKEILQIQLPDTEQLRNYLHKRNNISHRFAFSNIDRMRMSIINLNTLKNLIQCCNEFVDKLMEEINLIK